MMIELYGRYANAKIYTDNCEQEAQGQIMNLLNQPFAKDSHPRFMPDVHAGKGCTVGTTMCITDRVCPNLVGVDIGCGVLVTKFEADELDLKKLDEMLQGNQIVPSGFSRRNKPHPYTKLVDIKEMKCFSHIDYKGAMLSLGSLGGGNHFIEVNKDSEDGLYLVVHSGSRHLGLEVCKHYQSIAEKNEMTVDINAIVDELKAQDRHSEIEATIKKIKAENPIIPRDLRCVAGQDLEDYLHDMKIITQYAELSRQAMADEIIAYMGWTKVDSFSSIHNYIDVDNRIIRKGAISAEEEKKLIIPISMKDGSIIGIGKGNPDWNYSAPHGAGRVLSRSKAKELLTVKEFEESMKGIYTTCVGTSTLDESPMAYKTLEEIQGLIGDTVDIIDVIKPVYNFKAN